MGLKHVDAARAQLLALSELEAHLSFRVSRLCKLMDNHAAKNLCNADLNLTDYRILLVLKIFQEAAAADLSRMMVMDRAQISRSVAALRAGAFLVEREDPTNKRRKILRLTEEGHKALGAEEPFFLARQKTFEDVLSPAELAGLKAAIDKLSHYLANELDQPQAMPTSQSLLR